MEVKNYFATDTQGNVLGSAQVYLYLAGTTTLATGLQNISGAALGNPFTSNPNGLVQFKAPDNNYDLRVVKPGREFTIRIQCFDGIALIASGGADNLSYPIDGNYIKFGEKLRRSVSLTDFGVVTGPVSYAQAEENQRIINKAQDFIINTFGAGVLEWPRGQEVGVRRTPGGSSLRDSYCLARKNIWHRGQSTTVKRYGPTSIFYTDPSENAPGVLFSGMKFDGNPGIAGYTAYAASLVYLENTVDTFFFDCEFVDVPGLHAVDANGVNGLFMFRPKFKGYDVSLRGSDTTYLPESVQISRNLQDFSPSRRVSIIDPEFGPSQNYAAPLVGVGNHTGGGGTGHAVVDFKMTGARASGIVNYLVRPKAWRKVRLSDMQLSQSTAQSVYLDSKPANSTAGTPVVACEDVEVSDCDHDSDAPFLTTSFMSLTEDPVARHSDLRIFDTKVKGRPLYNALDLTFVRGLILRNFSAIGARRGLYGRWCSDVYVYESDLSGSELNGFQIDDSTGANAGKGFNRNINIFPGNKIKNSKDYGVYLGACTGGVLDGFDVGGSSAADGSKNAMQVFGGSSGMLIRGVFGRSPTGNKPTVGVNVTSGADNVVSDIDIECSGAMVTNFGSGSSIVKRVTLCGSGSPEGVRKADIGQLYSRIDGAAGTRLYMKTTGAGNTGWTAIL